MTLATDRQMLLVDEQVTVTQLKQRFRAIALEHHPDHGGDAVQFHEYRAAYDRVLQATLRRPCVTCLGSGEVVSARRGFHQVTTRCQVCHGTGRQVDL